MIKGILMLSEEGTPLVPTFAFGDRVKIDDGEIVATVIGLCIYPHAYQVQVTWWNNGSLVEQWVADWRLKAVEP